MKFTFNTGRSYTEEGQVIHVEVADGRIWFNDTSRGIAGSMECQNHTLSQRELEAAIMYCYDRGLCRYEPIPKAGEARGTDWQGKPAPAHRSHY